MVPNIITFKSNNIIRIPSFLASLYAVPINKSGNFGITFKASSRISL